ncbi:MAG: DVUA0089 family protein [Nitriliruptoraceae bacterium]
MAEPGWYEDPHRGGGRRWWDGQRWSEHAIPPPPTSPPGVIPPPPGAPTAGTAPGGPAGPTFVPAPGDLTPAMRPAATTPSAPGTSRPVTSGAAGGRSSRLLPVLLGLVALIAIGGVVAFLLSGDDGDDADDAVAPRVTGTVTAGEERSFSVPDGGEWELVVEAPAGLLVIDARGADDFDPVLTLFDADGRELATNDDRSSQQQGRYGGGTFDALIEQEVPAAGSYRIVITGFAGQGGSGQVSFPVVGG